MCKKIITVWRVFFKISCSPLWLQSPALTMKWDKPNLKKSSRSRRLLDISILVPADHVWLNGCVRRIYAHYGKMSHMESQCLFLFQKAVNQQDTRTHRQTMIISEKLLNIVSLHVSRRERERRRALPGSGKVTVISLTCSMSPWQTSVY